MIGNHVNETQTVMSDNKGAKEVDQLFSVTVKHDVLNTQANNVKQTANQELE